MLTLPILAFFFAVLLFALNVADCLLTDAVIAAGGHESNPLMAFLMARPLTAPLRWAIKLVIAVLLAWLIWELSEGWARVAFMALACAPFAWVVWHNAAVRARQKARKTAPA